MDWKVAFARQAGSDLDARDALLDASEELPECHQLHCLQMACEKLCKAYLIGHGSDPDALQSSHAYVAKTLPNIARHILSRQASQIPHDTWVIAAIRNLARRIELLAPAVRDGGRAETNCEYPWEKPDGEIVAPADFNFGLDLLHQKAGVTLLKVMRIAIAELLTR
ncbi:MAG: hypothetical protein ACAI43_11720 [Phycisphaerae bacterium]|nr:hypothetical protein [Tepidisphaeraceae bacterium]